MNWVDTLFMNSPVRPIMQREEARRMLRLGGEVRNGRVLEIGCGRGVGVETIFTLFHPLHVTAFDLDPTQAGLAKRRLLPKYRERVDIYEASATEIPGPDGYFDAVFDFGVLHHIPDNHKALGEVARVLKPGGRFFFMELLSFFTMNPLMRFLTQHPPDAQFTWEELAAKLKEAGLAVPEGSSAVSPLRVIGVAQKLIV